MTNTATGRRGARRTHLLAPSRVKWGASRVEPVLSHDMRHDDEEANAVNDDDDEQVLFENEEAFKYEGEEDEEEDEELFVNDERDQLLMDNNNQSRLNGAGSMEERNLRERVGGGGELGHEPESSRYFGIFSNYFLPYYSTASHLPYGSPTQNNIYQLPSGGGGGGGNDHQSLKKQTKSRSHSRLALLIPIFLLLLMFSSLLLIKLLSLIELKKLQLINRATTTTPTFKIDLTHLDDLHQRQLELEQMSRWLVSSPKCHIPKLEPWDGSIREYVHRQEPLECGNVISESLSDKASRHLYPTWGRTTQTLSFVRNQRLYFSSQALAQGALVGRCCMQSVNRSLENDDDLELTSPCEPIRHDGLKVNYSLIQVVCSAPLNYINVHKFIIHQEEEERALEQVAKVKLNEEQHYYNVLMVGVDTMSSLNAQRQLKRTLALLQDRFQTLHFEGYNKVGENTFPNLIPLLTGLRPEQLAEIQCWEVRNYTQGSDMADGWLDNCKYLWNYYQQLGYVTYFSEDWPEASTFNYLKSGFKNEPTTYYGRPFTLARKNLTYPQFESTGCALCQLDRPIVEVDLENLLAFIREHQTKPYFAFHWINCPPHDDLNGGSQIDNLLENFFQQLLNPDIINLNRTFVMLFSDHGYRWNDFVSTRIGHYESSLPLMTIAPAKLFIEQQAELYARLKEHRGALLTPFDIFKTLIDLKNLSSSTRKQLTKIKKRKVMGDLNIASPLEDIAISPADPMRKQIMAAPVEVISTNDNSIISEVKPLDGTTYKQKFQILSLFDKHTPEQLDRSCIDAGIPDNYCVCHQFQPMALNKTEALGAAYYLVYIHMGTKLRNHLGLCHALDLEKIHNVEVFKFNNNNNNTTNQSPLPHENQDSRKRRQVAPVSSPLLTNLSPIMHPLMSPAQMVSMFDPSHMAPLFKQQLTSLGIPQVYPPALSSSNGLSSKKKPDQLTTSRPKLSSTTTTTTNLMSEGSARLPDREYSVVFSTKPGSGLFQEVVRFYGGDMDKCEREILLARSIIDDLNSSYADRRASVKKMNSICEFSVHSRSMSRFNLYKEQSKCVTSDIELKKICYCNDLL